jgi:hypothetical protein
MKNENGQRKAEARPTGSEDKKAQRLGGHEGGEEKTHEPRLSEVRELTQAGTAKQVEIDCRRHQVWGDTQPHG